MQNWKQYYQEHLTTAEEAVRSALHEGDNVVYANGACNPQRFNKALYALRAEIPHISIFHVLYFDKALHLTPEMSGVVHPKINFMEKQSRTAYQEGRLDFYPTHFHEVPGLLRDGFYPPDVTVLQVTTPDADGYCSLGLSCDYGKLATELSRVVVAEVNRQMPRIGGPENKIHVSQLTHIIEVDYPPVAVPPAAIGEVEATIGRYCASLIGDGATLQLGIGAIPDAVLANLSDRKDLGIHTEMFSDGVMHLMKKGVITGKAKTLHPGKVVSTFITGTPELYEFLDGRDDVELYPVDYTNDPFLIGQNDNMVSINSCIEIDLYGQLTAESIGFRLFSGSGGQVDFLRGAKRSKGGFSIIAMPSTAAGGKLSRIVPTLQPGSIVTTSRNDVDYVVTEYGIARLRGKTMSERTHALISIAHPDFREQLEEAAREQIKYFR